MDLAKFNIRLKESLRESISSSSVSGGERARVAIARGFLRILYKMHKKQPITVIILDEINSALDVNVGFEIINSYLSLLNEYESQFGYRPITMAIEHDFKMTSTVTNKVIYFYRNNQAGELDSRYNILTSNILDLYNNNEEFRIRYANTTGFSTFNRVPFLKSLSNYPAIIAELKKQGGFFKGLYPLMARQVPYTVVKFVAFENTVKYVYRNILTREKKYLFKSYSTNSYIYFRILGWNILRFSISSCRYNGF